MKNIKYLFLVILLSISFSARSEKHYSSNVAIGAKGGMTLSRMFFSPSVQQKWLMGKAVGVNFRYMEEKNFGLIVEFNMEQRGWKEDFEGAPYNYSRQFTYLQLPILTHIFFGNSTIKGFFNLGPEIGYMISEKVSSNFDPTNLINLDDFPINNRNTEQLTLPINSKMDYGISAGAGMELKMKRKHSLMLEGRFYYGLGNVFSSHKKDYFSASTGMSIMITLGYMYRLK